MSKVGIVYGESSTDYFTFIVDPRNMPNFGEFVVVKNRNGDEVLAVVKGVRNINWLMGAGKGSYDYIEKTVNVFSKGVIDKSESIIASAKVLGVLKTKEDIERGNFEFRQIPNRVPIKPGEVVKLANDEDLKKIFSNGHIKIGRLLARENVEVGLDVNKLVSRHFAVLAVTGAGKSNTIAVLSKEIIDKTNGTIVILDPHGEYSTLSWRSSKVNPIKATIDPAKIKVSELATLLGVAENAALQRRFLSLAYYTVEWEAKKNSKILGGMAFVNALENKVEEWIRAYESKEKGEDVIIKYYDSQGKQLERKIQSRDLDSLIRLKDYLQELKTNFGEFIKLGNILSEIVPGMVNVIDLSGMEEDQMIALASYLLRGILKHRVQYMKAVRMNDSSKIRETREKFPALTKPILVIVEEAHIFAPREHKTQAAYWLGKIAREGRKFGIGLGIVSQRPKKLDDDILSQTNTKIILRLVEPHDQRYVQQASEQISEDLLIDIAALGIGEAVVVGFAIPLPAMVKIYNFKEEFNGYYGGGDIDIVKEWSEIEEESEITLEDLAGE
ncbi:ATP-binding protein [Thermococcus argininiproducens]|uniref:ATP-binding protein n=1 Tax=Thermococcus argininiproducens TaxID=2866384 RepID=A0A9E7SDF4_9EURY|nr:ATP-binding protein [Thermococcus argininiproducens]USH00537.1 ATP-binding protein [Thermococcus argininiproducens]